MCITDRSGALPWDRESEDTKVNLCVLKLYHY